MHASIADFPSKELYSSVLISHESVASRRLIDLPSIIDKDSEDAQDVLEPTLVFFDTAGTEMYERLEGDEVDSNVNKTSVGEGSRYNENEAEIVSKWVHQLVSMHGITFSYKMLTGLYPDISRYPRIRNRHHHTLPSSGGASVLLVARRISRTRLRLSRRNAGTGKRGEGDSISIIAKADVSRGRRWY